MISNTYFLLLLALLAGAMLPTQAAVNNRLAMAVESPVIAALISFVVGTLGLAAYVILSGGSFAEIASAKNAPPVAWTGGLIGAFFVASVVILLPRLGVAMTFSLIVAGQMILTLAIDHFGLLGVPVRPMTLARVAGVALVIAGVIIVRKFCQPLPFPDIIRTFFRNFPFRPVSNISTVGTGQKENRKCLTS